MSLEVCPFCGKTFKRLKSHLPHCKAAVKNPPPEQNVSANQKTPSPSLSPSAVLSKATAKGTKPRQAPSVSAGQQTKTSKKESKMPSAPPVTAATSRSPTLPSSMSSKSPPSLKKKKQKLTDQIPAAAVPFPTPPSPSSSEPEETGIHALVEASKSQQSANASPEGPSSASTDRLSNPIISRATPQIETKANPDKVPQSSFFSSDTKLKSPSKKRSKKDKATETFSTTEAASPPLDSKAKESRPRHSAGDTIRLCDEDKREDVPGTERFWSPGSDQQARITLQDVKAALGRSKPSGQASRLSFLSNIKTVDDRSGNDRRGTNLDPVPIGNQEPVAPSDQVRGASSQPVGITANEGNTTTCEHNVQDDGSPQQELHSAHSIRSPHPPPPVSQSQALAQTPAAFRGVKVGHQTTDVLAAPASLTRTFKERAAGSCSRSVYPVLQQSGPVRVDASRSGTPLLEFGKTNAADNATEDALTQRTLGEVRLKELPKWLAIKTPRRPRDLVEMTQRGWHWYYSKYIDVRKGGVGGVSMLLVGCCVLSYIWSYPHIKRDRWRKYH